MSGVTLPIVGSVTLGAAGIWTLVGTIVIAWFRLKPLMRKLQNEADGSLRGDLLKRIGALELQQVEDRRAFNEQREADRRACQDETEKLVTRIREQDRLIDGLQRQLIMFQLATGRALPPEVLSPQIQQMLETLGPLYGAAPAIDVQKRVDDRPAAKEDQ